MESVRDKKTLRKRISYIEVDLITHNYKNKLQKSRIMKRLLLVTSIICGFVACVPVEDKVEKKLTKVLEESGKTITMCQLTASENNVYEGYVECQLTEQQAKELFNSVPRLSLLFAEDSYKDLVGLKVCGHVKVLYDGKNIAILEEDLSPESAELIFNTLWGN